MAPLEGPVEELDEKYAGYIVKFVSDVRNGKLQGSNNIALAAITMLEQIINESQNATAYSLVVCLREVGRRLAAALPLQPVPANMARRVLRAVRDEARHTHAQGGEAGAGEGLQRLVLAAGARRCTLSANHHDLRGPLRDQLQELRVELESAETTLCASAREHVHGDELVLTVGGGDGAALAERFLRGCAQRRYRLLLAEGPCVKQSHAMAARLSASVPVTVVSNAAVCAVMSRVNKVVVGVHAALAGGAALGAPGLRAVTDAARHYSVPVIALAPLWALSPLHARHHHSALQAPHHAMPYQCAGAESAHVVSPQYDVVPPDHITLFVTNLGSSSPSYIYRLLSELYDPRDYNL